MKIFLSSHHVGWPVFGSILVFILRIPFLATGPGGWDDVDFALALKDYDMEQMQPHFPGYPIYILAAMAVRVFIDGDFLALSFLSALAGALSVFPLYFIFRTLCGVPTAILTMLLWAVAPLAMVLGTQPMSDSFGGLLAFMVMACCVVVLDPQRTEKGRATALVCSGIILGLLYGVRISYLMLGAVPVWAGYIYYRDTGQITDVIRSVAAAILTNLLWVFALAQNVGGWLALWQLGTSFTEGHFSDWGGTYHEEEPLWQRLFFLIGRQGFAAGMGTPWAGQSLFSYGVFLAVLFAFYYAVIPRSSLLHVLDRRWKGFLIAWGIPYFLWAFFAQNVDKPRHLFPLLPLLLWFVARGTVLGRNRWVGILLVFSMLLVGWTQVHLQRVENSPMVQLADFLAEATPHETQIVFTYEEERVIKNKYPAIRVVRLRKFKDFHTTLLNESVLPEHIYLTNSVLEGFLQSGNRLPVRETARFKGSEWLYPTYHSIILYEVETDKIKDLLR